MNESLIRFFTVTVYAFVPWAIVLFVLTIGINLPRTAFIILHYLVDVLVFGVVFHFFYETHKDTSAFTTTIITLVSLFVFEAIFWGFFSPDPGRFLNFVDWIFPAFLIATIVYALGKRS